LNEAARARHERDVLSVTSAAHFLVHCTLLVFPALATALGREFGLPFDRTVALGFPMFLLFGLGALPSGLLTDALGRPRVMLLVCLGGMGLSLLAASRAGDPAALRWSLASLGLFASIYHPAGMAWLSRDMRRRGWALGVNGVFGSLGEIAAPVTAGLLAALLGWRGVYAALAVPALAAAGLALRGGAGARPPEPPAAPAGSGPSRPRAARAFLALAGAMMLGGLVYRGQTVVLPTWFELRFTAAADWVAGLGVVAPENAGMVTATALTSLAYLAGAAGQLAGGRLADRHDLRRVYLLFHLATIPCLLLMGVLGGPGLLAAALVYSFFAFGMQPPENSLVAALTPPRLRSTGYGLKFILTFGVGALAVRLVGAWSTDDAGLGAVFPRLAAVAALLVGMVLVLMAASRGMRLRN